MTASVFRPALAPAALVAGLLCLPACGKKHADDGGAGGADQEPPLSTRATRPVSINNLKIIGLALLNYMDVNGTLPVGIADTSGQVGLSWRVQILPYIEQEALYKQFKLDEPWDSDHNKKLLDQMPKTYASAGKEPPAGHTFYRGFGGPHGMFFATNPSAAPGKGPRGRNVGSVQDGFSNTLMVVEAGEAVPWTKPD